MDTDLASPSVATYIERLKQAVRVMEELSATDQVNFTLQYWAQRRDNGMLCGCIAGHCGLDPWFQANGLTTTIMDRIDGIGSVSIFPEEFFGTEKPFYARNYESVQRRAPEDRRVKPDDAITALKDAISAFEILRSDPIDPIGSSQQRA